MQPKPVPDELPVTPLLEPLPPELDELADPELLPEPLPDPESPPEPPFPGEVCPLHAAIIATIPRAAAILMSRAYCSTRSGTGA